MPPLLASPTVGVARPEPVAAGLQPLEIEVIQLFLHLSRVLGQPRSIGAIYGLLFLSPRPLALDDLSARLQLSRGSTCEGLKFLRNLGAIQAVYVPGNRRTHYEAVVELRQVVSRFLRGKIESRLGEGEQRLKRLSALAEALPPDERHHVTQRIHLLRGWSRQGRRVFPVILRLLGG
jgi:DNA-binding transcriptional regulator GbsR (MarR family)